MASQHGAAARGWLNEIALLPRAAGLIACLSIFAWAARPVPAQDPPPADSESAVAPDAAVAESDPAPDATEYAELPLEMAQGRPLADDEVQPRRPTGASPIGVHPPPATDPDLPPTSVPADDGLIVIPAPPEVGDEPGNGGVPVVNGDGINVQEIPTGGASGTVSNVFYDTDLRQAIQDLATAAGQVVIATPEVQGYVSADIQDMPLRDALELLLAGSGYIVKPMHNYLLVTSVDPESKAFLEISESRILNLDHLKPSDALALLPAAMTPYVRTAPEGNRLVVTAPPVLLDRIVADILALDQTPPQFLLQARVVVLERTNLRDLGIEYDWPVLTAGAFSNSDRYGRGPDSGAEQWPWGIEVGYTPGGEFTESLMLTLNLMEQNDEAAVLASPQVMAQNGQQAIMQVTTEEYFEILTQGFYTNSELEKIESGTILSIRPTVGEGGRITLQLKAEVSDVVARGGNNLPVVTRRITENTVWIEDGGTAIIAGLTDTRNRKGSVRVPFLHRLPIIGRLFQSDISSDIERQVAVFITAHLMEGTPTEETVLPTEFWNKTTADQYEPAGKAFVAQMKDALDRYTERTLP